MKVKCVCVGTYVDITEGKVYEVAHETLKEYYLKDDGNDGYYYRKENFIVVCDTEEELELNNRIALAEEEIKAKEKELKELIEYRNKLIRRK